MNENKKIARLYVFLATAIAIAAVLFQYILYENYLELDTGIYIHNAKTPGAFYIFIIVAVILMATPALIFRKDLLPTELKRGTFITAITALLSAGTVAFCSISFFMDKSKISLITGVNLDTVEKIKTACAVVGFLAAVYYFFVAFSGENKSNFITFLSFFPVIWTLLLLMCLYFDRSGVINSPIKVLKQVALIVFMLYSLFEARASLGKSKPIIYFVFSNLAVIFLSAAFVPEIIYILRGTIELTVDSVFSIYCGASVLYILSRSIAFAESSNGNIVYAKKKSSHKHKDSLFEPEEDSE
ncbi:MAG: hypothetical protein IKU48_00550 [Clostridia bacterium]|nr:hypothetical protein [Clostridia bacterium]